MMNSSNFLGALLLASSALTADLQFPNVYNANEPPVDADPKWMMKGNVAEVSIAEGALSVKSEGEGQRQFYVMDESHGWNLSSTGNAVVEFRLKCASDDPEDEVFRVQLGDGQRMWRVIFFNRRCNGREVETSDWETYRVEIRNEKMSISSESKGVIQEGIEPSPFEDDAALLFGTFKGSTKHATRSWDLDFIRWNND